jgi:hypothetical protein
MDAVAAVVVIPSVVTPPPESEIGPKRHVAPAGKPEQELALKLMVPV